MAPNAPDHPDRPGVPDQPGVPDRPGPPDRAVVRGLRGDSRGKVLLVCLPDRDLCPERLRALAEMLAPSIDVAAVDEPDADHRIGGPPMRGTAERADRAAAALRGLTDRPLVLFGHGTEAVLAFEIARRLERGPGAGPVAVFAAGCRAPSLFRLDVPEGPHLPGADDEAAGPLADVVPLRARGRRTRFTGAECHHTPAPHAPGHRDADCRHEPGHRDAECRHDPGHRDAECRHDPGHSEADCCHEAEVHEAERHLELVRAPRAPADLYTCGEDDKVRAGILALGASRDPRARVADVLAWAGHTTGAFEFRIFPGGPRILHEHLPHVANAVTDFLLPVIVGGVLDPGGPEPEPLG
ncbi:thioesterase II family protein [Actinomadura rupiterrae]|uniref:thioesterase II family protein n=1 Tax=Actinomadura rupiterrae TaxID=559627 RepID=UPI0020A53DE3|nr:thioesterase domain-containing protein [Actinomadura rupiterrae]MCP2342692.1 surfactin synthase thioesterase subunit [Actinomadura rupiterrae]